MKEYIGQIIGIAVVTILERVVSKLIEKNKNLKSNSVTELAINAIKKNKL